MLHHLARYTEKGIWIECGERLWVLVKKILEASGEGGESVFANSFLYAFIFQLTMGMNCP